MNEPATGTASEVATSSAEAPRSPHVLDAPTRAALAIYAACLAAVIVLYHFQ